MSLELSVSSVGFGDHLITFSVLCNIPEDIVLCIPKESHLHSVYTDLKRIFCIDDKKLSIVDRNSPNDLAGNWHLGTFCDYMYPTKLNIKNRFIDLPRNKDRKFTIGLVCYGGTDYFIDRNDNLIRNHYLGNINEGQRDKYKAPRCKYRSLDYYSKMFYFLKTMGYDVITLDHPSNLEHKIENLLNCAAVVGYEGGISHLCTMLKIPCFMIDWNESDDAQYKDFQCEMIHQSKTTYFLNDDNELFEYSGREFDTIIDKLNNGGSNNRFLTGKSYFTYNKVTNKINIFNKDGTQLHECHGPFLSATSKELIDTYKLNKWTHENTFR